MFNIFSFFKKASKESRDPSNFETIESNLRKDIDRDAAPNYHVNLNKNLSESRGKDAEDLHIVEKVMSKTRKDSNQMVIEGQIEDSIKRNAGEDLQIPLVNVMSLENDRKNNELFSNAMKSTKKEESIFKKYVNKQLNRDPHMVQTNIGSDRSELPNNIERIKDKGFVPTDYSDFQKNNNDIASRKSIELEKIASSLEKVCKLDEIILTEMVNAKTSGKPIDKDLIRHAESKKKEILSKIALSDEEHQDDVYVNLDVIMQRHCG
jgi:hypothetical protein